MSTSELAADELVLPQVVNNVVDGPRTLNHHTIGVVAETSHGGRFTQVFSLQIAPSPANLEPQSTERPR